MAAWMDIGWNIVQETNEFGFKVTHNLHKPDLVLVMDEVGQKGDGNVGGELQICERGKIPQRKINTKEKHYTVLGLTAISGNLVMCITIFSGEQPSTIVETRLNLEAETVGHPDN